MLQEVAVQWLLGCVVVFCEGGGRVQVQVQVQVLRLQVSIQKVGSVDCFYCQSSLPPQQSSVFMLGTLCPSSSLLLLQTNHVDEVMRSSFVTASEIHCVIESGAPRGQSIKSIPC